MADQAKHDFLVEPDCWQSWEIFQDVADQWRFKPDGQLIGLDMPAAMLAIELTEQDKQKHLLLWRDLRYISDGVKQAIREQAHD